MNDTTAPELPPHEKTSNWKKRRRPARSCEQCRQRKVRCDLEEPCGPCTRARGGLVCSYESTAVREPPPPVGGAGGHPQGSRTSTLGRPFDAGSREQVSAAAPASLWKDDAPSSRQTKRIAAERPVVGSDLSVPPPPPRLRLAPDRSKLYRPTHWMYTSEKVSS
jgi:hypothetical protein